MANYLLVITFILISSCSKKNQNFKISKTESLFEQSQKIIANNCISCHKNYNYETEEAWLNSGLISPGDPSKSALLRSIKGNLFHQGKRNMPPKPNAPLNSAQIEVLNQWVLSLQSKQEYVTSFKKLSSYKEKFPLGKKEKFKRCFENLTKKPFSLNEYDYYLAKNTKEPCHALLGDLRNNGKRKTSLLRTIQDIHNSWFENYNLLTNNENWGSYELLDPNTPAYFFTLPLINKNFSINDIFDGQYSPKAVREKESKYIIYTPNIKTIEKDKFLYKIGDNEDDAQDWLPKPTVLKSGQLKDIGFWKGGQSTIKTVYLSENDNSRDALMTNIDIHRGLGAGVLGNKVFLLLNFGHAPGTFMDGGQKVVRSWSKAVFKSLLCRDLPVIKAQDSVKFVQNDSPISFRRSISCMNCHASLDPMAGSVRHFSMGLNNLFSSIVNDESKGPYYLQSSIPFSYNELYQPPISNDYLKGKNSGTFYYRTIQNQLIDKTFKNLDELSNIILGLDDFYYCTVTKYFEALTGINLNFEKLFVKSNSAEEEYIQSLIHQLAMELKDNRDPYLVLEKIISSSIYLDRQFQITRKEYGEHPGK